MDLHPTRDHDEISDVTARYVAGEFPLDRKPSITERSLSPAQWTDLAAMGWLGMGLAESDGGLGMTVVEEALVLREFGRGLLPPSTLGTMLAAHLAAAVGDREQLAALVSGGARAAIAIPVHEQDRDGIPTCAFRLVDTDRADIAIGWSRHGAFLAPLAAFVNRAQAPSLDATIEVCTADGVDAAGLKWTPDSETQLNRRAQVLTAAMLTGGAEAVRDLSANYAKTRQQFGRPIGAFQAIAHPCADMAVRCEAALSCLFYAAVCERDGLPERETFAASARSVAHAAAYDNATASMQIHGGYGQTYDYLPHFYLKRAMIYGLFGGGVQADEASILCGDSLL